MSGHRSGSLRQSNKQHKHGKHKSKGQLDIASKGKVETSANAHKKRHEASRTERKNKAKQLRTQKREDLMRERKLCGGVDGPSQIVALVGLNDGADLAAAKVLLQKTAASGDAEGQTLHPLNYVEGPTTCLATRLKHKFTVIDCPSDLFSTLEIVKYADVVIFVLDCLDTPSETGESILSAIRSFAMPASICVAQGFEKIPVKNRGEVKKAFLKYISLNFQQEKLFALDTENDGNLFLRHLSQMKRKKMAWRSHHPFIVSDDVQYDPTINNGTLKVTGYIRGAALSANQAVSIRNYGTYLVDKIVSAEDPYTKRRGGDIDVEEAILSSPNEHQETLKTENEVNPLEAEQTWPTDEEIAEFRGEHENKQVLRVPKGTSTYQASWMVDECERSDEEYEDMGQEEDDFMDVSGDEMSEDGGDDDEDDDDDYEDIEGEMDADQYDKLNEIEEEMHEFQKLKKKRIDEDLEFPDEIDTPLDQNARDRFAKYRGLQSFRDSKWDKLETLPEEYSRIFTFPDFVSTCNAAKKENRFGLQVGIYVTVYLSNVPKEVYENHDKMLPFTLNFLLRFENKMSVVNFVINRVADNDSTIKSKENLVYLTPLGMFSGSTIFSQHTRYDKYKFERYFHSEFSTIMASVYAPVHYAPCPVLAFQPTETGGLKLLGSGRVWSSDPNRIILKRIVLTGWFYKINVKTCTLRFMFFNRDDIDWFKPVELSTKYGLRGHIQEGLGTHGHMKCSFNGTLRSEDTVCMNLYKRVFCKWNYQPIQYFRTATPTETTLLSSVATSTSNTSEGTMMDYME